MRIRREAVDCACHVIQDQTLSLMIFAKRDHPVRGVRQFTVIDDVAIHVTESPELARVVIAVNVGSVKFLEP